VTCDVSLGSQTIDRRLGPLFGPTTLLGVEPLKISGCMVGSFGSLAPPQSHRRAPFPLAPGLPDVAFRSPDDGAKSLVPGVPGAPGVLGVSIVGVP